MARRQAPGDWLAPAAAVTTLLLVEILRVWLPSVTFVFGRAGTTPATTMGAFAALWFVLPFGLLPLLRRRSTGIIFGGAGLSLAGLRLLLQAVPGGDPQLWVASLGVLAGLLALTALAAGAPSGHVARVGVLAGLLLQGVLHLALATFGLVWRDGTTALIAVVVLVAGGALLVLRAASAPGWAPQASPGLRGPAWPWLAVGPAVAVITIVSTVPGRLDATTTMPVGVTVGLLAAAHLAGLGVALLAPVIGSARLGLPGAILTLAGVVMALQSTGPVVTAGQLAVPVGVGAVVGSLAAVRSTASAARRGTSLAVSWVLFLLIGFLYYAAYDMALGFPNRALLLVGAAGLAALGVTAGVNTRAPREPAPLRRAVPTLTAVVLVGSLLTGVGAHLALDPPIRSVGPRTTISAVLANVQMGYDVSGRQVPPRQAAVLAAREPDVVVLNEVDRGWLLTGGTDNLRLLQRGLALPHEVFAPAADEVWGNALLTRYPLIERRVIRLPREGAPMARSVATGVIDLGGGRELGVIGTHLHHVEAEPEIRLRQVRAVAGEVARLRQRGLEVIVLGDLNAEPGAPELEPLEQLLRHAVPPGNPTWPAWDPEVQIDHVLVSDGIAVELAEVIPTLTSDHRYVHVELTLR